MHPRHLTGLPGNFCTGVRLASRFARNILPTIALLLCTASVLAGGNVVEYTYDTVGNITNIDRHATSGLAITTVSPASGVVGSSVTIYGSGFSATPANNAVQFNGTTAAVTASDSGSIATSVPSGATTGHVTVTVAGVTATSAQSFTVTVAGAPTLTSFTPVSGASGTSVSVVGTAFDPAAGATTVKLNGVTATASVGSATALTFTVPVAAASGRITATTAAGTGASMADFIVPPPGLAASDIAATLRIAAGDPNANIAMGIANKSALVLFDGAANGWDSLPINSLETSPTNAVVPYSVIKPDNTVLVSGTLGLNLNNSIHLPKLAASGTYSLLMSRGTATLNTNVRLVANPLLVVNGASAATALDYGYQSTRFIFDATASQRIGIGAFGVAFTPSYVTGPVVLHIYKADGTSFDSVNCLANSQATCDYEIIAPASGTYTLVTENALGFFSNASLQLSGNVTGTLALDVSQVVTLTRVGQDAQYTFTAAAGDSFGLDISAAAQVPQARPIAISFLKPDGSALASSCSGTPPANVYCELGTLATAGTYTVLLDPDYGTYGSFSLTLKQGALLTTTDPPTSFAPAATPESARLRFVATAGQTLAIGISGLAYTGTGSGASTLYVYAPNQSSDYATCNTTFAGSGCHLTWPNTVAGTYSVVLRPPTNVKVTGSATLSSDLTGTLIAGTPQTINAARVGQRARFTFAGTAGDSTSVKLYGVTTTPVSQTLDVTVYKPDGSSLANTTLSGGSTLINLASLPVTGTYSVVVVTNTGAVTWQGQLSLDPGTLVSIDASATTLANSVAGERMRYRFAGTAGQKVDVGVGGLAYAAGGSGITVMSVYRPDGFDIWDANCSVGAASCAAHFASLPSTGTYSVVFAPPSAVSVTAGNFLISTPLAGTLVVGDPAQTIATTRAGQSARYTFSGTAAQLLRLGWTSTTVTGSGWVDITVLKPDNTTLSTSYFYNAGTGTLDIASLPTTGTYTVVFAPNSGATMSAPVTLVTR